MSRNRSAAVKVPPYSVHAEKVVLGSLLSDTTLLEDIRTAIPSSDAFFRPEHSRLYATLLKDRQYNSLQDDDRTAALIDDLKSQAQPHERAIAQARIVANKWHMRTFIDTIADILNDAYHADGDVTPVLNRAQERLDEFAVRFDVSE